MKYRPRRLSTFLGWLAAKGKKAGLAAVASAKKAFSKKSLKTGAAMGGVNQGSKSTASGKDCSAKGVCRKGEFCPLGRNPKCQRCKPCKLGQFNDKCGFSSSGMKLKQGAGGICTKCDSCSSGKVRIDCGAKPGYSGGQQAREEGRCASCHTLCPAKSFPKSCDPSPQGLGAVFKSGSSYRRHKGREADLCEKCEDKCSTSNCEKPSGATGSFHCFVNFEKCTWQVTIVSEWLSELVGK